MKSRCRQRRRWCRRATESIRHRDSFSAGRSRRCSGEVAAERWVSFDQALLSSSAAVIRPVQGKKAVAPYDVAVGQLPSSRGPSESDVSSSVSRCRSWRSKPVARLGQLLTRVRWRSACLPPSLAPARQAAAHAASATAPNGTPSSRSTACRLIARAGIQLPLEAAFVATQARRARRRSARQGDDVFRLQRADAEDSRSLAAQLVAAARRRRRSRCSTRRRRRRARRHRRACCDLRRRAGRS